jgi:hypothetical protein
MAAPRTPGDLTQSARQGVAADGEVVVGVEVDTVMEGEKKDDKRTYPCREVESEW